MIKVKVTSLCLVVKQRSTGSTVAPRPNYPCREAGPRQGSSGRDDVPTSNHKLRGRKYTRFAYWRFMDRARLNTLPLKGCPRWGNEDRCRRCGRHNDTTSYILSLLVYDVRITKSHDATLELLGSEIRGHPQKIRLGKRVLFQELVPVVEVPKVVASLRSDLETIDRSKIVRLVDVTVPYEGGWQSVTTVRKKKLEMNAPVARLLSAGGYRTSVYTFVVGSLGTWDSTNRITFSRLIVDSRRDSALDHRCVSKFFRWSRDIYVEHVMGIKLYTG
ncbi:uncharacterized protein LOC124355813 [Homalodisca vitripennis]|uniref:uncharacterized protein LOC124355813 n=1 Tax=Homalodisca vitripennis TaxID=197043 RepID=UPI001EECA49F|nr:uncharacterized protein LOC124355813 [Homalodisca vitripennis]